MTHPDNSWRSAAGFSRIRRLLQAQFRMTHLLTRLLLRQHPNRVQVS